MAYKATTEVGENWDFEYEFNIQNFLLEKPYFWIMCDSF